MNPGFRYLIGFNGYPVSAVLAVVFHCLVLAFILYWNGSSSSSEFDLVQPTVIKALFIDENPQLRERQRLERQRVVRQQEEEQRRQQEQQEEQQQQEDDRLRREEEERLRQQQLERQLEQQRQQELLQQAEQQRLDDERRQQEELAQQQRLQQEQDAQRRRQQEEAAAAAARTEFEVVQSGVALIQQIVEENWSRPPSARNGMRAVLRISMLPTGEVTEVVILESSGDPAFDRSAETAVFRAEPFSELGAMPINIFNTNFRLLSLIFEPEDLLN